MAGQDQFIPSNADGGAQFMPSNGDGGGAVITITSTVMVAAVIFFFLLVVFVFLLYLYARRYLGPSQRRLSRTRFIFAEDLVPGPCSGLEASVLRSLPVTVYRAADFEEGLECAVCLSVLADGEEARLLPKCNHGFHLECIDTWFHSHATCPLCRSPVGPQIAAAPVSAEADEPAQDPPSDDVLPELPVFPTNVLFWGSLDQVNAGSSATSAVAAQGVGGGPSGSSCESSTRKPGGKLSDAIKQEDFCNQSGLEHEAKNKTCSPLLETPTKARKSSQKIDFQVSNEDGIASVFNSWPSGGSAKPQHLDGPFYSVAPIGVNNNSGLPEKGYACCNFGEKCTQGIKLQLKSIEQVSEDELEDKSLLVESSPLNTKSKVQTFGFNESPNSTPLHLKCEMPSPATVYPVSVERTKPEKCDRIRTQYVYPILKPVENPIQWKETREVIPRHVQSVDWSEQQLKSPKGHDIVAKQKSPINSGLLSPKLSDTSFLSSGDKRIQEENFVSIRNSSSSEFTDATEKLNLKPGAPEAVVTCISQCLKLQPLTIDADGIDYMSKEQSQLLKPFDEDRPIIGIVAAHWNDIQSSHATPKWWNGNGIPNSTKKYKEDQKVSWHATLFEERLEKVL